MDFAPDSLRLAVGQSDEVVYVYRLPKERDKSELAVVGKYAQFSPVTCLLWTSRGTLVYGLQDGKIRCASGSKNSDTLHQTDVTVVQVLANQAGTVLVSAHNDGSIFTYVLDNETFQHAKKILTSPRPTSCVTFAGDSLLIATSDSVVTVYDLTGKRLQEIAAPTQGRSWQPMTAAAAPNGQYAVFAAFDRLRLFSFVSRKGTWVENDPVVVENLYLVPALSWKKDGTKLLASSLFGVVDMFDCALRKRLTQDKYEITHIAGDQVLIRDIASDKRFSLRSESGAGINKVAVLKDFPLAVASTSTHLILMSMEDGATSEVSWNWKSSPDMKPSFHLDGHGCVVYYDNKLSVIELWRNEVLVTVATPNFYSRFFSLQMNSNPKVFVCLPNRKTLRVTDLNRQQTVATMKHDIDLDWVTLNNAGTVVVARDVRYAVMLFFVGSKDKMVMCQRSTFVELVQGTDTLVVQEDKMMRVWSNISDGKDGKDAMAEQKKPIEGKISEIVQRSGQIIVQVQNGDEIVTHVLEDDSGQFDNALKRLDLDRAFAYWTATPESPVKESNFQTLIIKCLDNRNFQLAERVFASRKDPREKDIKDLVARTQSLQKEHNRPLEEILGHYTVKANIERLKGDFSAAEKILLAQRDHKRAIVMQSNAENYVRALQVAQEYEPALVPDLVTKYQSQLTKENKIGPLGLILAYTGHLGEAANLYLAPPFKPLEAYRLVVAYPETVKTAEGKVLLDQLVPVLRKSGLWEMVGRVSELRGEVDAALEAYRKGHIYEHAIEYARQHRPEDVVPLETECARYLVGIRKWQDAISHFIEANMNVEALEAAIHCLDFKKAAEILSVVEDNAIVKEYGQRLAVHFQDRDELQEAVEMYRKIGKPKEAIKMYLSRGKIDEAFAYAERSMKTNDALEIFRNEAQTMVTAKRYSEAERLFLLLRDPDAAVDMYMRAEQFQRAIALVKAHKPHLLDDIHTQIGEICRKNGNLRQAELYYSKAQRYKELVQMYVEDEKWPDAFRSAQEHMKEMADDILYLWIGRLGVQDGIAILRNLGVAKEFIRMAMRSGEFDNASQVANEIAPDLLPEISIQRANMLAESGQHEEAEREYLAADNPNQAIQMYIDANKWSEAIRLTTTYFPDELPQVLMSHAVLLSDSGQYHEAEHEFLNLNRPDHVINMYKSQNMWEDAIRVARQYRPAEAQALEMQSNKAAITRPRTGRPGDQLIQQARGKEDSSDYTAAVKLYLRYLQETPSADPNQLVRVCARVRELATSFLGELEARNALEIVANKLLSLNRSNIAAGIFSEIGDTEKALDVYMEANIWEEARALVLRLQNPQLTKRLDARYKDALRTQGKVDQLASMDAASAVEIYARNGEWEKCLKVCMEIRDLKLLAKYLQQYASVLLKNGEDVKALELLTNYGAPVTDAGLIGIYRQLFYTFLPQTFKDIGEGFRIWSSMRDLIFNMGENVLRSNTEISVGVTAEFEKYLQISLYYASHYSMISEESTKEMAYMILLSLLRYSDVINPDKAFYDAGRAAKELKFSGTADVLLNFYLDWRECIIHQNIGLVDYAQFAGSDIPVNVKIPSDHSVTNEAYEEVKTWIMKAALDRNLKFELKKDERGVFEISLSGGRYPPCVLTGYPVLSNGVKLGTTGRYARKADLNRFLQAIRSTRSEKLEDLRRFLVKWCGAATELNYAFV
ncbi:intraflagellar transport protein 172 homolog isoform X2 [Paramacrobiotus metropolitanus]|nr:intraflagellar transport protein 172 homolog isoform X2 [Paramacrobiotus metropolitanus]